MFFPRYGGWEWLIFFSHLTFLRYYYLKKGIFNEKQFRNIFIIALMGVGGGG